MRRTTTAEGVLEAIYSVAGTSPPPESEEDIFRGHPLAVQPKGAGAIFYIIWPSVVVAAAFLVRRRHS